MPSGELYDWIGPLPDAPKQAVLSRMHEIHVKAGQTMYALDDQTSVTYRVKSGFIRLYLLDPTGTEVLLKIYQTGECLGGLGIFDDGMTPVFAAAQSDCTLLGLTRADYHELREIYPQIERCQLQFFAKMVRRLIIFYHEATAYNLSVRIASRLHWLHEHESINCGNDAALKTSHYDLAAMVGASRPAVSRVLSKFKKLGMIETNYGKISITNLELLKRKMCPTSKV